MPLSTDVSLPKSQEPVFPDKCIVCHAESPGNTVKIGTNSVSWSSVLLWWFGSWYRVKVPACKTCAFRLQARRQGAMVVCLILTAVVVFFLAPWLTPLVAKPLRRWVLMIGVLLCLSPFFLWEVLFPPAFEMTAFTDSVDYEFRDANYAEQFMELNFTDEELFLLRNISNRD